jgi:DNA-3-methyladenine glycosylase II
MAITVLDIEETSMQYYTYGQTETDYLKRKDSELGAIIDATGMIRREVIPDLFAALINNIVSQQISAKAAVTVYTRIQERFGGITPETIAAASCEEIQKCGISMRKAGYIHNIGVVVHQQDLDLSALSSLPDDEVIRRLSSLSGVGRWTAEMLLIFSMERPDVVSWDDLAIRRGMMAVYGLTDLTKEQFERYRQRYSPYGTVASLYLWAAAHQ